jgi:hypothetical protein
VIPSYGAASVQPDGTVARYSWDRIAADTARLYEKSMSALAGERTAA